MRRAIGKPHPRVVALDDGRFARTDREAPIAAVLVTLPAQIEAIAVGRVTVDGTDATRRLTGLLRRLGPLDGVHAILLDGAVVGGFNVVDLNALARATGRPVIAVTRRRPSFSKIRAALDRWFPRSADRRWAVLRQHRLVEVPTGAAPLWLAAAGCPAADAVRLVARARTRGYWPEPLRLAHLVASAAAGGRERTVKGRARPRSDGPVA